MGTLFFYYFFLFFLGCLCGRAINKPSKPSNFFSGFIPQPSDARIRTLFHDISTQWQWLEIEGRTVKHHCDTMTDGVPLWNLPLHQLMYHFFLKCGYGEPGTKIKLVPSDLLNSFQDYIHHILHAYGKTGRHWRVLWNTSRINSERQGVAVLSNITKATKVLFFSELREWYPIHTSVDIQSHVTNQLLGWIDRRSFHVAVRNPILTERRLSSDHHHLSMNIGHRGYVRCAREGNVAFQHCGIGNAYNFDWSTLIEPIIIEDDSDYDEDTVIDLTMD